MSNSSDRGDRIWDEFHASLAFHVNTRPSCSCDACAMIGARIEFTTVATDEESRQVRALFQNNRAVTPATTGAFMRTTAKHADATFSIRALPGCGLRDHFYTNVPDAVLEILTEAAVAELAAGGPPASPNLGIISGLVWSRTRAIEYAPQRTVSDALCTSAGVANPFRVIESIIRALVTAGDLEATLTAERARIDAMLALLAKRHGAEPTVRRRRRQAGDVHYLAPVDQPA